MSACQSWQWQQGRGGEGRQGEFLPHMRYNAADLEENGPIEGKDGETLNQRPIHSITAHFVTVAGTSSHRQHRIHPSTLFTTTH